MRKHDEFGGIYRYFYLNREKDIFSNLTQLKCASPKEYSAYLRQNDLAVRSYDERYIKARLDTEKSLYDEFVQKGGKPRVKHPYYFTLGKCDEWFYGRKGAFGCVGFSLEEFNADEISFTYGDSMPNFMEEYRDGKEYRGQVYTLPEINEIIEKYGMPNEWNTFERFGPENYIEVQVWSNEFASALTLKSTTFIDMSVEETATRMMLCSDNISQNPLTQKSLEYYVRKCKVHPKWRWFCELIKRVPESEFCANRVHGLAHAQKCALTAFVFAIESDLRPIDLETLVYAAFFHDIGRRYFDEGKRHGLIGAEKVTSYIGENDFVYADLLKEALAKHDDSELPSDRNNRFLIWLRDIDSLDYLRLGMGRYTTRFLKTDAAKSLVKCVTELNIEMFLDDDRYIRNLIS